jgi:hypothetical protein
VRLVARFTVSVAIPPLLSPPFSPRGDCFFSLFFSVVWNRRWNWAAVDRGDTLSVTVFLPLYAVPFNGRVAFTAARRSLHLVITADN